MKTSFRILILSASITGLALAASPALAQGPGGRGDREPPSQEERAEARTEMLAALDLSADQTARVEAVLDTLDAERTALMETARGSGDRDAMKEVRDEMKQLREAADTQLESIMSEDQYAQYEKLRRTQRGGRGERGGRGRGGR